MEQTPAIYLGVFAFLAFVLKAIILFNTRITSRISRCFAVLCLFFVVQNVAEFLGYLTYGNSTALGYLFLHIYMTALYFIFPSILMLALALAESPRFQPVMMLVYSLATALAAAHAAGYVISGFQVFRWTVITTPGPLYGLSMLFLLANILATVGYLLYHFLRNKSFEIRHRCKINLIAFAPLVAVAVAVIALRAAGFNSSSAISLPLATTIFLFVLLLQTNGNLFWVSLKLRTVLELLRMSGASSTEEVLAKLEEVRIREALRASNGQQRAAAQLLGLSEPTLSRRVARYAIDVSRYQTGR